MVHIRRGPLILHHRNAALGLGDGDDRIFPDQISIQPPIDPAELQKIGLAMRFSPIHSGGEVVQGRSRILEVVHMGGKGSAKWMVVVRRCKGEGG